MPQTVISTIMSKSVKHFDYFDLKEYISVKTQFVLLLCIHIACYSWFDDHSLRIYDVNIILKGQNDMIRFVQANGKQVSKLRKLLTLCGGNPPVTGGFPP